MSFQFPFPTLKNLSMITICQAVLENRTRRMLQYYRYLDTSDEEEEEDEDMEAEDIDDEDIEAEDIEVNDYQELPAHEFVPHLVQISQLRHDLADVYSGMQRQTHSIVSHFKGIKKAKDVALIFDVHGRLDVPAVWRCYFEDQLNKVQSLKSAMDLLDCALGWKMWCEIGPIFAKIMSLVGLDADSFPKPELICNDDDGRYMLSYDIQALIDEQCANIGNRLVTLIDLERRLDIDDDTDHLLIPLYKLCEDYTFIREFFITMDTNEKESFFEQIISRLYWSNDAAYFIADMITDLNAGMLRYLMVQFSEGGTLFKSNVPRHILYNMLNWPFSHFFMPLLEFWAPVLTTYDYAKLFQEITDQVPCFGICFGTLKSNLLLRFCQAIPSNVKPELFQRYEKKMTKSLAYLRDMNSQLCDMIVTILSPQVE